MAFLWLPGLNRGESTYPMATGHKPMTPLSGNTP
jgi:hypothetical protein